ncbi:hypothetical protein [Streptomyces indicus]|uniref:hypothetical protein n=1 Tax=Streptomyces indicus TaxID=417292 RepID=UPI00115F8CB4|nr:hypothetical protein [Streptomyces indicus]
MAAGVLLAAGCSSGSSGDGDWLRGLQSAEATPDEKEPPPSPSTTPPLTDSEYTALLGDTADPLNEALRTLQKARSDEAVDGALTAAADAAVQAQSTLTEADAPERITAEHSSYATALGALAADLGTARQGRDDGALCTGTAATARFGSGKSLKALRDAARALDDNGYPTGLALPAFPKETDRRLKNGKFVKDGSRGGRGVLKIDGAATDAVVTLARGGKAVFSVYVRKNSKAQVQRVSDGDYTIYFTAGSDWNGKARTFNRNCSFDKFEKKARFTTRTSATQITYTIFTIGLKTSLTGNSPVTPVDPGELPK